MKNKKLAKEHREFSIRFFLRKDVFFPLVLFIITFLIYSFFASGSVFGGDSGDLLSAIAVFGIPHPSGYPLFVMSGMLFNLIPLSSSPAWRVAVGSAFFSSLALVFIYLTLLRISKNAFLSFVSALSLAFFFPFWLYAQITEVMALQHLLIAGILYFAIVFKETKRNKPLFITAFLCGLSLTNNQTMLFLLPVVFILVISGMLKSTSFFKTLLLALVFFTLGLLPYLYLPIAASFHPPVNWNNPVTVSAFFKVVFRQDYGWTPKTVTDSSIKLLILKRYFSYLFSEFTFLGVLLIILGAMSALLDKSKRLVFVSLLTGFFLFGPFFVYYGAGPMFDTFSDAAREKFVASSVLFLIPFLTLGMLAVLSGSLRLLKKITVAEDRVVLYQKALTLFFLVLPCILFLKNLPVLDLRDSTRITEVFARELLLPLPKNTVVIAQHDNVLFPVWYMEYAKGIRNDVYATLPGELEDLARRGMLHLQKNPMTTALDTDSDPDNPIHDIALQLPTSVVISESDYHSFIKADHIILYPFGLVLKYANVSDQKMSEKTFLQKQNSLLESLSNPNVLFSEKKKDRLWLLTNFPLFYAHAYSNTGYFLMYRYHDYTLARKYFQKAVAIDDQDHWGYEGLGITYYEQKQYKNARNAFLKAVAITPLNHNAYFLLYGSYLALHDTEKAKSLEQFFRQYKSIYTEFNYKKTRVQIPR